MSEALWAIRPTGEQAVESPPKSVHAQEQLERTAQGYEVELQRDTQAVLVTAATGSASSPSAKQSRCSFCRAELDQSLKLTIPGSRLSGQRGPTGLFCSTHCRNCVLALAALHPSPLTFSSSVHSSPMGCSTYGDVDRGQTRRLFKMTCLHRL